MPGTTRRVVALAILLALTCSTACTATSPTCSITLSSVPLSLQGVPQLGTGKVSGTPAAEGQLAAASINCTGGSPAVIKASQLILDALAQPGSTKGVELVASDETSGAVLEFEGADVTLADSTFSYLREALSLRLVFSNSRVRLQRCSFIGNSAGSGGPLISITKGSEVVMDACSMMVNTAGVVADGLIVVDESSSLEAIGLVAQNNVNNGGAGLLTARGNSTLDIVNSTFISNAGGWGGAVFANGSSSVRLSHTAFFNNSARLMGGAVASIESRLELVNCSLINNTAGEGGGLYSQDSEARISGTVFYSNSAVNGAGVFQVGCMGGLTTDSSFVENVASESGGGLFQMSCDADIARSKFSGNVAKIGAAILQIDSPGAVSSILFNYTTSGPIASSFYSINSGPIHLEELTFVPDSVRDSAVFVS